MGLNLRVVHELQYTPSRRRVRLFVDRCYALTIDADLENAAM